ncbi:toxin-antitoxin system TumE family protein [Desulfonema magnum]|uniref:Uncharacterized protein n=1 Tax=Desulfonema magnum TaxID=45655 RepID=A0A975BIK8_9BACT|nr:DUF6516 family protein [Desulfonema magnum]QTA85779.1 Uncharacterized protein dnm_017940 [Desulfonema magnum]
MIETYFAQLEKTLQEFRNIRSYTLTKKVYNFKQGFVSGKVVFEDNSRLDFTEVRDTDVKGKIKYRYQYMNEKNELIFRYDNAPHHREISTYPHHKHVSEEVEDSSEPVLREVLFEIAWKSREGQ